LFEGQVLLQSLSRRYFSADNPWQLVQYVLSSAQVLHGREQLKLTVRNFDIESNFLDSKNVKVSNLNESVVMFVCVGF
jgi:hypothetical protein